MDLVGFDKKYQIRPNPSHPIKSDQFKYGSNQIQPNPTNCTQINPQVPSAMTRTLVITILPNSRQESNPANCHMTQQVFIFFAKPPKSQTEYAVDIHPQNRVNNSHMLVNKEV